MGSFSGWQEGVVREVERLGVDSIAASLFAASETAAASPLRVMQNFQ